jgi:DNA-binding NarL/FixJ family response regulator
MTTATLNDITTVLISQNVLLVRGVTSLLPNLSRIKSIRDEGALQTLSPRLVIVDVEPEHQLLDIASRLRTLVPDAKLILLIGFAHCGSGPAAEAIADGIMLKYQGPEVLLALAHSLLNRDPTESSHDEGPSLDTPMNESDQRLIELVNQGLSNREIASQLSISIGSVRSRLTGIYSKFGGAPGGRLTTRR